jgi:hypothetical protein
VWIVVNEVLQWMGLTLLGLIAWRLLVHQKADRFGDEAVMNTLERVAPEVWGEELDRVTPELMRHSKRHGISEE